MDVFVDKEGVERWESSPTFTTLVRPQRATTFHFLKKQKGKVIDV
jgi:hypothetical protein